MTELGHTDDPRALVPGHLATVEADAATLGDHGRRLADLAHRLREVRVDGWGGRAGRRFVESWSQQPPAWFQVADALHRASTALIHYLDMLDWAQAEAAAAIELWNRGQARARDAEPRSGHQVDLGKNTPAGSRTVGIDPAADPEGRLRADARERLDDARAQLRAAGDSLADELLATFGPADPGADPLTPFGPADPGGDPLTPFGPADPGGDPLTPFGPADPRDDPLTPLRLIDGPMPDLRGGSVATVRPERPPLDPR